MSFLVDSDVEEICNSIDDLKPKLSGKNILITGSNGFLGKYFAAVFHKLNESLPQRCEVTLIDNFVVPNEKDKSACYDFDFYQHDIKNEFINPTEKDFDYIINAAGIASPHWYNKYPVQTIEVGIDGLIQMLKLSVKEKSRLLFFSSSEVYGTPPEEFIPTKESYVGQIPTLTKRSSYDISKLMGETLTYVYNDLGADAVIVRPFNFSGPGMSKNDHRVLPNFISKAINNEQIVIYGDGLQTRTLTYITDAIAGCLRIMIDGEKGEPYNVGNPNSEISMNDLVDKISQVTNLSVKKVKIPSPINYVSEPLRRCPDVSKANALGYTSKVEIDEIIRRFYQWALTNF